MKDENIVDVAAKGFVHLVIVPVTVGTVVSLGSIMYCAGADVFNVLRHKRKIRKGLKDGSIVKIDGEYFEIQTIEEA